MLDLEGERAPIKYNRDITGLSTQFLVYTDFSISPIYCDRTRKQNIEKEKIIRKGNTAF